jgi:uncharacterized protein
VGPRPLSDVGARPLNFTVRPPEPTVVRKHPKRTARPGIDAYGRSPLHYAAAEGNSLTLERLLGEGADPNSQDDDGWTPAHFAAQSNSAACLELLLRAGANLALTDTHGNTVLFRAVFASRGSGEIIRMLRAAGADAYAQNSSGISPLSLARTIANYNVAQFFADLP